MSDSGISDSGISDSGISDSGMSDNPRPIAVANAPVSYGAFELTVGHDPNVPDGATVLDRVAAAGYDGIDLGPVGYLGDREQLGELLAERGPAEPAQPVCAGSIAGIRR
jgi:hypothetical protein